MPYAKRTKRRTYRKPKTRPRRKARTKRQAGYRQGGYLNTIQSASWKPKSVVVRHKYQNTFKTAAFSTYAGTQKNLSLRFTPNNASIFDDHLIPPQFASSKLINTSYGTGGVTTYDDLLEYQTAYRQMQVLGVKYTINVRFAGPIPDAQPTKYPIKIIMTRQTTPVAITPDLTSTPEILESRPYTITRTMQQTQGGSKGAAISFNHTARVSNGIPKTSWIGHTKYTPELTNNLNIGAVVVAGSPQLNAIALEGDYVNFYITSASSAAETDIPELLVTLQTSHIVRYSEPSFISDSPYPQ